jgi:hypothetical protein
MHGTKASDLLSRLTGSKQVLCFLLILPALVVTRASGQESVLVLAMISYDQSPSRPAAVARNDSAAIPLGNSSAPCLQYHLARLQADHPDTIGFSYDFLFEKNDGSNLCDQTQFIYKKSDTDGHLARRVHVEAGYGQFCQFESSFGNNDLEQEQPSCAYLRACFSF